jgi:hypothetical protein
LVAGACVTAMLCTAVATGNPALAENLRKSPVAEMAAGATTVADQLAIRRFGNQFGNQPPTGQTYQGTGFVLPRRGVGFHNGYFHRGYGDYSGGRYPGVDYNDDRLRDNFDLDHYDDKKPYGGREDIGRWGYGHYGYGGELYPFRNRPSVRVIGTGFNTVFYGYNPFFRGVNRWWWDPYPYGIDGRLVNGIQPGSQLRMPGAYTAPGGAPLPEPEPETDIESARRLLSQSDFAEAVEKYRAHLAENADDFDAMAELVVALAGDNRLDDAAALARMTYDRDPGLASRAVDGRVSLDSRDLRRTLVRAVRFAHDRESASAWLLVTLLMQAEDRDSVGLTMLERAVDRGLPSGISDPLKAAMR